LSSRSLTTSYLHAQLISLQVSGSKQTPYVFAHSRIYSSYIYQVCKSSKSWASYQYSFSLFVSKLANFSSYSHL